MQTEVILAGFGIISSIVGIVGGLVAARSNAINREIRGKYDTRLKELENQKQESAAQSALELKLTDLIAKSVEYQQQTAKASAQTARRIAQQVDATNGMKDAINRMSDRVDNMSTRMEDWDDHTRDTMQRILGAFEVIEAGITVSYNAQEEAANTLQSVMALVDELRGIPAQTQAAVASVVADALRQIETLLTNNLAIKPVVGLLIEETAKDNP